MTKAQLHVCWYSQCEDSTIKYKKKSKETTECDKNIGTYDVSITQCKDGTIKCERKIRKPPNVTKAQSHMILILYKVRIVPSNVRKNKGTTECDKSTFTCNVSITQYEDGTIKYDVLVT